MDVLTRPLLLIVFLWLVILVDGEGRQQAFLSLAVRCH